MRVVQHAVLRDFVDAERGGCLALRARPLPSVVNEHGFLIHPRLPEGFFAPGWFRCAAGFFGFERRIAERGGCLAIFDRSPTPFGRERTPSGVLHLPPSPGNASLF